MTTQPATHEAQLITTGNASIQAVLKSIPANATNATKCHAMQACDRAANALMRAAIAEQAHDPDTRARNMAMYRNNLDRAREIIRAAQDRHPKTH